jgi:hypothetical protein
VKRIGELGTKLAATSNRRTLRRNTSILHSHRRENLKSYTGFYLVHSASEDRTAFYIEIRRWTMSRNVFVL